MCNESLFYVGLLTVLCGDIRVNINRVFVGEIVTSHSSVDQKLTITHHRREKREKEKKNFFEFIYKWNTLVIIKFSKTKGETQNIFFCVSF